jgi:hypothetical protein
MLNKEDRAMVREAARGLTGAAKSNFENAVIARLQAALDSGVIQPPGSQTRANSRTSPIAASGLRRTTKG